VGLMYMLRIENPLNFFHPLMPDMICPNIKNTTLKSVLEALKETVNVVKVPEDIRVPAKEALDRMLAITKPVRKDED